MNIFFLCRSFNLCSISVFLSNRFTSFHQSAAVFLFFRIFSFIGFTKFYFSQPFLPPFLTVFLSFCSSFYLFIHPFMHLAFLPFNSFFYSPFSIILTLLSIHQPILSLILPSFQSIILLYFLFHLFIHPFHHSLFLSFNPFFFSPFSIVLSLSSIHPSIPSHILPSFQPIILLSFLLYLFIHLFLHSPFLPFNPFSFSPFPIILSFHLFISHSLAHPSFLSTHLPFLLSLFLPPRALALSHPFPLSRATPSYLPD